MSLCQIVRKYIHPSKRGRPRVWYLKHILGRMMKYAPLWSYTSTPYLTLDSCVTLWHIIQNRPLTRCVKVWVAMRRIPGTLSPPPTSKVTATYRSRHASRRVSHARAVMHVGIANRRWRGKRSWHSWRMRNPCFDVSGKRPIAWDNKMIVIICMRRLRMDNRAKLSEWNLQDECGFMRSYEYVINTNSVALIT